MHDILLWAIFGAIVAGVIVMAVVFGVLLWLLKRDLPKPYKYDEDELDWEYQELCEEEYGY